MFGQFIVNGLIINYNMKIKKKSIIDIGTAKIALGVGLFACIIIYIFGNNKIVEDYYNSISSGERMVIGMLHKTQEAPDSVIFINTAYDQEIAQYYEYDSLYGKQATKTIAVANRGKLLRFLQSLERDGSKYSYILLDIRFEKGYETEYDTALYAQIVRMPRIVIPKHGEESLANSSLEKKAGRSDYGINKNESDFSKYQYIIDGEPSVALKMFNDCKKRNIRKCGFLYFDGCVPAKVNFPLTIINDYKAPRTDLSNVEDGFGNFANKIIVIGDLTENDNHNTYIRELSGSEINLIAYWNLVKGYHKIQLWWAFIVYIAITLIAYVILYNGKWIKLLTNHKFWGVRLLGQLLSLFVKYTALSYFVIIMVYLLTNRILELPSVAVVFTILTIVSNVFIKEKMKQ